MSSNLTLKPINDIKKVIEHINEAKVVEALRILMVRVDKIEEELKNKKQKSSARRIPTQAELAIEALGDNKIQSVHGIAEKIQETYPNLIPPKVSSLMSVCSKLAKDGKITRVGNGAYRIPKTE